MRKFVDLTGQKFGRLTVIERVGVKNHHSLWKCKCDCGNLHYATIDNLKGGHTKSCGCIAKEIMTGNKYRQTHGGTHSRLYNIWHSIKQRTQNPKTINFSLYGGKGITMCEEWKNSFETFRDWSIKNGYSESLSIDRINGECGYTPENCRWVDMKTQQNNRCNNHLITYNGETHTLSQWAEKIGIKPKTLSARIFDSKWSEEKALTTPLMKHYK